MSLLPPCAGGASLLGLSFPMWEHKEGQVLPGLTQGTRGDQPATRMQWRGLRVTPPHPAHRCGNRREQGPSCDQQTPDLHPRTVPRPRQRSELTLILGCPVLRERDSVWHGGQGAEAQGLSEEGPTHSCDPLSASLRAPLAPVQPCPALRPHPSPTGLAAHEGKQAGPCPGQLGEWDRPRQPEGRQRAAARRLPR